MEFPKKLYKIQEVNYEKKYPKMILKEITDRMRSGFAEVISIKELSLEFLKKKKPKNQIISSTNWQLVIAKEISEE